MSVIAKKVSRKQYEIPAEGAVLATLVEVRDLGEVQSAYGKKAKVLFVWDTDETDEKGMPLKVFERLSNTLHPMGRLAPRIRSITGEAPDENEDYNLSELEGSRVQLVIEHNRTEDSVYANIAAVVRQKTAQEEAEEKRVRRVEAAVRERTPVVVAGEPRPEPITDSDIPF